MRQAIRSDCRRYSQSQNPKFSSLFSVSFSVDLILRSSEMAAGRIISQLLRKRWQIQSCTPLLVPSAASNAYQSSKLGKNKSVRALMVIGAGISGIFSFTIVATADDAETCPRYPWPHQGILDSLVNDNSLVRRGQQVYQQTCSACHSFSLFSNRDHGVLDAKEVNNNLIVDIEVFDGPNDEGKTFVCPSKLCDPNLVFKSERTPTILNVAHTAHSSFITKAPDNRQSRMLSLLAGNPDLTGSFWNQKYLHYNPYFFKGATAMPKMLIGSAVDNNYKAATPEKEMIQYFVN
ncbi:cytochrome c1 2, heme protein, mitochondrial-like isoform X1 [Zingiber officinale]|uniref:cytochrome c1 2, heme protein, mitochondrial-like isoform X1 n=2 Tax=Zingiber officinale TaxID=94328 RepID=UPI001C4BB8FB|nr:cytochrome c1 2, heme protein, mitochondrial-like isoform X1 [Zingiber officinale]